MTDTASNSHRSPLADHVSRTLRKTGKLADGTLIARGVVIVQTVRTLADGSLYYELHRLYPFGEVDGSTERGLFADAIEDSRSERHAV